MQGRKPLVYHLRNADEQDLQALVRIGEVPQRVANRARVLLALDRGERIVEIVHWLGVGRMTVWELGQRYQQRGIEAIWDAERSGRPVGFSPAAAGPDRTGGVYRPGRLRTARDEVGLPQSGSSGGRAGGGRCDPLPDGGAHLGGGQPAPPSQSLLENRYHR